MRAVGVRWPVANVRKHRAWYSILICTFILLAIGLVTIFATSPQYVNSHSYDYDSEYFFFRQVVFVFFGAAAYAVTRLVPYEHLRKITKILLFISLGACLVLWIASWLGLSLANCSGGACRWLDFGPVNFQSSELLKFSLILYLAQLLAERKKTGSMDATAEWRAWRRQKNQGNFQKLWTKLKEFWLPLIGYVGVSLFFVVVVQSDLSTGVVIAVIVLAMLFLSGMKARQLVPLLAVGLAAGLIAICLTGYRLERLQTLFGGDEGSDSYQIENSLIAIGSGGLFGVGLGNSVQSTGYLPQPLDDAIFSVIGETTGFVGSAVVVGVFAVLLFILLKVATRLPTEPGLVVVGIWAWIGAHVLINIMAMVNIIPVTGITLPLISSGGTSLVCMLAGLGLASQLSCYTKREVNADEDSSRRRGVRGAYYAGRRRGAGDSR